MRPSASLEGHSCGGGGKGQICLQSFCDVVGLKADKFASCSLGAQLNLLTNFHALLLSATELSVLNHLFLIISFRRLGILLILWWQGRGKELKKQIRAYLHRTDFFMSAVR